MNYTTLFLVYLSALVSLGILDYLWLGIVTQSHIQSRLGHLLRENIQWGPAIAFYVLYSVSIIIFAVMPAIQAGSYKTALIYGGLLGFTAYMTYDMTNRATLKDRPVAMVVPDILWGSVVTSLVAGIAYYTYTIIV